MQYKEKLIELIIHLIHCTKYMEFKVDRLQMIVVAKNINLCCNCASVGCLKCVQFHNWFWPYSNSPIPTAEYFRRTTHNVSTVYASGK